MYTDEQRRKDALHEYCFIEDLIDRFDQRSLSIKSWSVTLTSAVFAVSIIRDSALLALLATGAAVVFWYLEGIWKFFQEALFKRVANLEVIIQTDIGSYDGPRINQCFKQHFQVVREQMYDWSAATAQAQTILSRASGKLNCESQEKAAIKINHLSTKIFLFTFQKPFGPAMYFCPMQ